MSLTLALAGDTMLGRGVADKLERTAKPDAFFSAEIRDPLAEADFVLLNLECCLSARGTPWPGKRFHFRAPPQAADLLAGLGVDCVTLANNHALDYGHDALHDTRRHLTQAGIRHVGAGDHLAEARRPLQVEAGGLRIAIVAFADPPRTSPPAPPSLALPTPTSPPGRPRGSKRRGAEGETPPPK